jgi:chromosome partitioning protein
MTKIISFATQKGGAGKTTLLMLTAAAIHKRTNKKVLVVDSDPQQSVKTIYKKEQEKGLNCYDVFAFNWNQPQPEINFEKTLTLAKKKYDIILSDVPGNIKSIELYHSLVNSDIVMVPIVASILDINATITFLSYLEDMAKEHNKTWEVYGVINKKDKTVEHSLLHKLAGKAGMQLFYSSISNLVRYRRLVSTANDIVEVTTKDDEFNQYFDEFRKNCFI